MKSWMQESIEKKIGDFCTSLIADLSDSSRLVALEQENCSLRDKLDQGESCVKDGYNALRDLLQAAIDKEQPAAYAGHHGLLNAMEAAQEDFRNRLSVLEDMHNLKAGQKQAWHPKT